MSDGSGPQLPPGAGPPEEVEELPTIPPAPRGGPALRWAVPEPLRGWESPRPPDPPTRQVPGLAWTTSSPEPVHEEAYEEAHEERRPDGAARRRVGRVLVAAVVVAALAGGAAVVVAHVDKPRPALVFEQLLEDSARAHGLVEAAVNDACRVTAPGQAPRTTSVADLEEAVSIRSSVLAPYVLVAPRRLVSPTGPSCSSGWGL